MLHHGKLLLFIVKVEVKLKPDLQGLESTRGSRGKYK